MIYNKLVRDNIPDMIRAKGEIPRTRTLEQEEYLRCLEDKLDEETGEFHRDKTAEELADILEVVYALAESIGCSKAELLAIYDQKHLERGGFRDRVFLISKE